MIHNKYYEILKHYTMDVNQGLYGRQLISKVSLSPKAIANAFNELEEQNILKSFAQGNIKIFKINRENKSTFDIMLSVEILKKIEFMNEHAKIKHIFDTDERIVGIFGSYAKGNMQKNSDLDIFVIGIKSSLDYAKTGKLYDIDISIKYFKPDEFRTMFNDKNPLACEIVENHILICGFEKFMRIVW